MTVTGRHVTAGSWTLTLPTGIELLSLNHRHHWAERNRRTQTLRTASWALARQARIPPADRIKVTMVYHPADRRRRDTDNLSATLKPCLDGLVDAGVVADDDSSRVTSSIVIGEPCRPAKVTLLISSETELGHAVAQYRRHRPHREDDIVLIETDDDINSSRPTTSTPTR